MESFEITIIACLFENIVKLARNMEIIEITIIGCLFENIDKLLII